MSLDTSMQRLWYGKQSRFAAALLLPLSWLFGAVTALRRAGYRFGIFPKHSVARPVIVIGNITVGGTGKTPFTIWLAKLLHERGLIVGIVLRGYGGRSRHWPRHVTANMPWQEVGDEAVLLANCTHAIVVAGPDRVKDAQDAISLGAQVVISDDGLQHYRLRRDAEVLVTDGRRGVGNGRLLPAGPLREPVGRLDAVDLHVVTLRAQQDPRGVEPKTTVPQIAVFAKVANARSLVADETRKLSSFCGSRVHAVAAIGHPDAFFEALRAYGLDLVEHAYPDHAALRREHIDFSDDAAVLMTEKDAVKCAAIADRRHWAVPLELEVDPAAREAVCRLLDRVLPGQVARGNS